jgi:hypothetical protein
VNAHTSPDIDRDLASVLQDSWMARAISAPLRHFGRAWQSSRFHAAATHATTVGARLSTKGRVQVAGIAGAAAMIVHAVLVLLDARAVEPLVFLLPAAVLVLCVVLIAFAGRVALMLERLG